MPDFFGRVHELRPRGHAFAIDVLEQRVVQLAAFVLHARGARRELLEARIADLNKAIRRLGGRT